MDTACTAPSPLPSSVTFSSVRALKTLTTASSQAGRAVVRRVRLRSGAGAWQAHAPSPCHEAMSEPSLLNCAPRHGTLRARLGVSASAGGEAQTL